MVWTYQINEEQMVQEGYGLDTNKERKEAGETTRLFNLLMLDQ